MSLQKRLDAIRRSFEAEAPEEVLSVMHRAADDVRASGILDRVIGVGDMAPGFELTATSGQQVTLGDLLARGPLVLGFYRGRW